MKFLASFLLILLASVLTLVQGQVPFANCATGSTGMTVTAFSLTPYPLCANQNVCLTATGTLSEPIIAGARLQITGRYLGRIVYTDNQDFCALLAAQGYTCPVSINLTSITACLLVKPSAPIG
ncbi:hypothetical protein BGZ83_004732, partial [Gryganskiella cystojenkinii]